MYDERQLDIINALYVIKGVCVLNAKCDSCPIYVHNACYLQYKSPDYWDINDADEVWRAFK